MGNLDLDCAFALLGGGLLALAPRARAIPSALVAPARGTALPAGLTCAALTALQPLVRAAVSVGVSANSITALSLVAGAGAGACLAWGHFGIAAVLFGAAACGDALDGLVARATRTQSVGGALFDASVDRYEEFFAFGGLAMFFRSSGVLLALTLIALAGAFMVSYGSARAEASHVEVPRGVMRRAERAVTLGMGIALCPIAETASRSLGAPAWARELPVIIALTIIAAVANVSAVRRLQRIALALSVPLPGDVPTQRSVDAWLPSRPLLAVGPDASAQRPPAVPASAAVQPSRRESVAHLRDAVGPPAR
jgi:CDP-diacylglycerol--glycerol-3-phosphate 3-phosphatidyltransferase